jgi:hypothetical protein
MKDNGNYRPLSYFQLMEVSLRELLHPFVDRRHHRNNPADGLPSIGDDHSRTCLDLLDEVAELLFQLSDSHGVLGHGAPL